MDEILRYVWGEYRAWATTSRVLKQRAARVGMLVLGLTLLGTALGTLSPLVAPRVSDLVPEWVVKMVPWVAAGVLGIATYLTSQLLGESERQAWVKTRALAEALKSDAHKYVTSAPPYDGANASHLLTEKVADAQRLVQGVLAVAITDEERGKHMPAGPWTVAEYAERRVRDQIKFYRDGVERHGRIITRAKWLALGFGILAVLLGAAGTDGPLAWAAPALGLVTTAAAAVAVWFQGGHHQALALGYQAAAARLSLLLAQYHAGALHGAQLVVEAETVMQAEHAVWLAEWQQDPAGRPPADAAPAQSASSSPDASSSGQAPAEPGT